MLPFFAKAISKDVGGIRNCMQNIRSNKLKVATCISKWQFLAIVD